MAWCHRITACAELDGAHQDQQIQLLSLCRTPQKSHPVPERAVQTYVGASVILIQSMKVSVHTVQLHNNRLIGETLKS